MSPGEAIYQLCFALIFGFDLFVLARDTDYHFEVSIFSMRAVSYVSQKIPTGISKVGCTLGFPV